ncbi:Cytochrome P450 2J6-like protein, partial [Leptotrombidium deliense]
SGRPQTEYYIIGFVHSKTGIIAAEGDIWSIQQKFMLQKLTGLGMGKTDFSYRIHDVCDDLISYLKEEKEIANLYMYLSNFTSNVISSLLYGKTYHPDDPIYAQLVSNIETFMGTGKDLSFYLTGPLFKLLILSQRKVWNQFVASKEQVFNFMYDRVKERIENKETNEGEFNDILDYLMKEMNGPNAWMSD